MSDSQSTTASKKPYEIGYGRPPVHTRFKKGQSGYPEGRRRGSLNARTILEGTLTKKVRARKNSKTRLMTTLEAINQVHANKAAQGDHRSAKLIFDLISRLGAFKAENAAVIEPPPQALQPPTLTLADALLAGLDVDLLSRDEQIELSRLIVLVEEGGNVTALRTDQFERFKQLIEKGQRAGPNKGPQSLN